MRFRWGAIPEDPAFEPAPGEWTPLREPSPWLAQLLAIPVAMAVVVALLFVWPTGVPVGAVRGLSFALLAAVLIGLIPVHELTHILVHPGQGRSPATLVGFWPKTLLFWAQYEGELTRNRFVAILAAPFLALTVIPAVVCAVLGVAPRLIVLLTFLNGAVTCVDLLGVLLLTQIPATAIVRNKGYKTWWRSPA